MGTYNGFICHDAQISNHSAIHYLMIFIQCGNIARVMILTGVNNEI